MSKTMAAKTRQSRRGGYSLVELMIAIGILAVGLSMVSTMLPSGILSNAESNQYATTTSILSSAMPTIRMSVSNSDMSQYIASSYAADPAKTDPAPTSPHVLTCPVYAWPNVSPAINFTVLPIMGYVYPSPVEPVSAAQPGYFQIANCATYGLNTNLYYLSSDPDGRHWFSWANPHDGNKPYAVPGNRNGWMLAVYPVLPNAYSCPPYPAQSDVSAANDYLFILFPYRKILPGDVAHEDFRFLQVELTNGYVSAVWDPQSSSRVVVDVNNNKIVNGLTNSPVVNMTDPRLGVRKLVHDVINVPPPGPSGNHAVLWTGNNTDSGWWLGVQSMNADVSPAVGCYVFRDRLKD